MTRDSSLYNRKISNKLEDRENTSVDSPLAKTFYSQLKGKYNRITQR